MLVEAVGHCSGGGWCFSCGVSLTTLYNKNDDNNSNSFLIPQGTELLLGFGNVHNDNEGDDSIIVIMVMMIVKKIITIVI